MPSTVRLPGASNTSPEWKGASTMHGPSSNLDTIAYRRAEKFAMCDRAIERYRAGLHRADCRILRAEDELRAGRDIHALRHRDATTSLDLKTARGTCTVDLAIQNVGCAKEIGDEKVGGFLVEMHRRTDLLNNPLVEDDDAVADCVGLFLIVRDEDRGELQSLLEFTQLPGNLNAHLRIEVGERLVEQ